MDFLPQMVHGVFYSLALCVVLCAVAMAVVQNVWRTILLFFLQCLCLFALYLTLRAEYLAIAQLVVYVGGSMVLLIYCAMSIPRQPPPKKTIEWFKNTMATLFVAGVGFCLQRVMMPLERLIINRKGDFHDFPQYKLSDIGKAFMTTHVYALELTGLLLLVALAASATLVTAHKH